jgi:hypothetical protein
VNANQDKIINATKPHILVGKTATANENKTIIDAKPHMLLEANKKKTNNFRQSGGNRSDGAVVQDALTCQNSNCSLHASGNFTRHVAPGVANYSEFLSGFQNQGRDDAAICEFRHTNFWSHFPHTMQQLYACISWWNGHPSQPSVLAWSRTEQETKLRSKRFVAGIITSLVNNNNLTFLDLDTTPRPENTVFAQGMDGYVVESPTHLQVFGDATVQDLFPGRARTGCVMTASTTSLGDLASPRIGILNRIDRRSLENVNVLACELGQAFPMSSVTIKEFETASFMDQVDFYSSIDILISPHGAQLTGLPFMPTCGGLVELTPKGYHIPSFFGSLAIGSGLEYGYVYMSRGDGTNETIVASATIEGRREVRKANLCPPSENIVDAVRVLIDDWHQCCKRVTV